ncbi:MAG TPA: tetratricopeptide repeat protein [Gemmatimonadales bacterium]|nr:tetratricopeptide repeat protein [Gemmatimonadales bacterium]
MNVRGAWYLVRGAWYLVRGGVLAVAVTATAPQRLSAQTEAADAAWAREDFNTARVEYEKVLALEYGNVRANYRLGILLSWDNKLDSSLVLLARARAGDPADVDLELMQARVLGWAARTDQAVAHYDSVIARAPDKQEAWLGKAQVLGWAGRYADADATYQEWLVRAPDDQEALAGRARLKAWQGDLVGARALYGTALERNAGNAMALTGLAQVDRWEGHEEQALARADSALRLAPNDRDALLLRRELRAALRPQVRLELGWGEDSDDNVTWWQTLAVSDRIAGGLTITGTVGAFQASDPVNEGDRTSGELALAWNRGRLGVSGGVGVRSLSGDVGADRSVATMRATLGWRASPTVGLGLGVARTPFDETARLIGSDLDVTSLEGNVDIKARRQLDVGVGIGAAWLSDGNSRRSLLGAATWSFARYFFAGPAYRHVYYDRAGIGYFAPKPYQLLDLRAGGARRWGAWGARLSGGLGTQRIDSGNGQDAWHAEFRLTRSFRVLDEVALWGNITNAASASTTGAFRYKSAGMTVRIGL